MKFSGALLPGNITHPAASSHCERATRVISHLSPFSLKQSPPLPPPSPLPRASFTRPACPTRTKRQMRNTRISIERARDRKSRELALANQTGIEMIESWRDVRTDNYFRESHFRYRRVFNLDLANYIFIRVLHFKYENLSETHFRITPRRTRCEI